MKNYYKLMLAAMAATIGLSAAATDVNGTFKTTDGIPMKFKVLTKGDAGNTVSLEHYKGKPQYGSYSSSTYINDADRFTVPQTIVDPTDNTEYTVTRLGDYAFYGLSKLLGVSVPKTVTEYGAHTFEGCKALTKLPLAEGITSIGISCFANCEQAAAITLPQSLTSIGATCFKNCKAVTTFTVPDGVTSAMGANMWQGCTELVTINLGKGVTSYDPQAAAQCYKLEAVNISADNAKLSSAAGVVYDKAQAKLISYPAGKADAEYTMPATVTEVGMRTFQNVANIEKVVFSPNVTTVGNYVFLINKKLSQVVLSGKMTKLSDNMFSNCSALNNVVVPASVTTFGSSPFNGCKSLMSLTFESAKPVTVTYKKNMLGIDTLLTAVRVPLGSEQAYHSAEGWKSIHNLVAYSASMGEIFGKGQQAGSGFVYKYQCTTPSVVGAAVEAGGKNALYAHSDVWTRIELDSAAAGVDHGSVISSITGWIAADKTLHATELNADGTTGDAGIKTYDNADKALAEAELHEVMDVSKAAYTNDGGTEKLDGSAANTSLYYKGGIAFAAGSSYALRAVKFDANSLAVLGNVEVVTPTAVENVAAGKQVKSVEYYSAGGARLAGPQSGVNVVVTTYTDGTRATAKCIK